MSATEPEKARPDHAAGSGGAGEHIVLLDTVGTIAFTVTAVLEVVLFRHWTQVVGVTVALRSSPSAVPPSWPGTPERSSAAAPTRSPSPASSS